MIHNHPEVVAVQPGGRCLSPNAALIGVPGSRNRLDTPALLVDLGALTRNIAAMAEFAAARYVQLRPHVKTHKSVEIAVRQIAAGAIGVSCATLGEAEIMADAGIPSVLITSPIVTVEKIARLVSLVRRTSPGEVLVVVDHPRNVADLAEAVAGAGLSLDVMIDYAAGFHRTGTADAVAVVDLARQIKRYPFLHLRGLQAYAGNIQHLVNREQRSQAAAAVRVSTAAVIAAAARCGFVFEIVTGAGTGTCDVDSRECLFTELQTGSYVFLDAEYMPVLASQNGALPFEVSLFVQTAVVSVNHPDWVTVDGGLKCFATDTGLPIVARGTDPAGCYAFCGDEHGLLFPAGARPELGARIEFVTSHCDPTVNLHNVYHVVDGEMLVDIWPVDARGK